MTSKTITADDQDLVRVSRMILDAIVSITGGFSPYAVVGGMISAATVLAATRGITEADFIEALENVVADLQSGKINFDGYARVS